MTTKHDLRERKNQRVKEACNLYSSGVSGPEIARRMGISRGRVYQLISISGKYAEVLDNHNKVITKKIKKDLERFCGYVKCKKKFIGDRGNYRVYCNSTCRKAQRRYIRNLRDMLYNKKNNVRKT